VSRLRWYVKKAARGGLALGAFGSGALLAQRLVSPGARVRALTYHRFGSVARDPFCVAARDFDQQVGWIASEGLAVSLDDVIAFARGERPLRDGSVLVTIDDGCVSTLEVALPILRKHGVPSVAFVTSSLIGVGELGLPERYMTWDELRRCAGSGMAIGSHAFSHRSLGQMTLAEARQEARRSREQLEGELGVGTVKAFAYPFGTHGDFSEETDRALADAGYAIAFNSQHGAIRPGSLRPGSVRAAAAGEITSLPRVKVEGGEALWMFKLLAQGAMDPWRVIDENLWRLQRVRKEIVAG
jgi:peptidoglycan/xylan/chitin deacetylase (PgdA/CDA1 family)